MRFLCLICAEKVMEQMTDADAEGHFDEYARFTADVRASGHFVDCNGCSRPLPRRRCAYATARCRRPTGHSPKRRSNSAAITCSRRGT